MKRIFKKSKRSFLLLAALVLLTFSCTKVINVDLNSVAPQIVIQATIPDSTALDTVQLSQTVNFSQPNTYPPMSGAHVIINDSNGNTNTLVESPAGTYTTQKLTGIPGRTYTMSVTANGKTYTASSTMPAPVSIDTLLVENSVFGRSKNKQVSIVFHDPAGINNFYRFIERINSTGNTRNYVTSDKLQDGETITFPLIGQEDSVKAGDTVTVFLESIDNGTYQYFISLDNAKGGGGPNVAPANPTSNISNSALGYFSAYSVRSKTIIVK